MAKAKSSEDIGVEQPQVRLPKFRASLCPINKSHTNTRVYSTRGTVRHCVCDECGETWKQTGDSPLVEYLNELATALDQAPRVEEGGTSMVLMSDADAREISERLRTLLVG